MERAGQEHAARAVMPATAGTLPRAWAPPSASSRVLYAGSRVRVGAFHCPREHPDFRRQGAATTGFELVFPRVPVWIRSGGAAPFVADAATALLFNPVPCFERVPLDRRGDRSDWFQFDQEMAVGAVACFEPLRDGAEAAPLRFPHAPVEPRVYLAQRRLCARLERGEPVEALEVEETVAALLHAVLAARYGRGGRSPGACRDPVSPGVRLAVTQTRRILAERFRLPLTLGEMATEVGLSTFHLVRSFRRVTGGTVHGWLTRLRLHTALEEVCHTEDLSMLALDLGFSSHSHFTASFRRAFGATPSALRAQLRTRDVRQMQRRLRRSS